MVTRTVTGICWARPTKASSVIWIFRRYRAIPHTIRADTQTMSMERTGARVMLHFISQGNNIEFTGFLCKIASYSHALSLALSKYIGSMRKLRAISASDSTNTSRHIPTGTIPNTTVGKPTSISVSSASSRSVPHRL